MDLRESMSVSGSGSYYIHKGFHDSGSGSGSGPLTHSGLHASPGYMPIANPNISGQSNVRDNSLVSAFSAENASPNIGYGLNMGPPSSGGGGGGAVSTGEPAKKKRGRPRKYGPGGTHMSLELSSPLSPPTGQIIAANPKKARGRPRGTGRKQQLAKVGEWMNSSAGMAFTPHIIHVAVGEDIASKVLTFAQNRQRALCILSGSGSVSSVSFRQQTPSSSTNATFEGRFQILCLTGSYLVDEKGDHNRTGGLSVSLCSTDGHVIGGAVGGMLIASSPTNVIASSFIYGGGGGNKATTATKMVVSQKKKKKSKKKSSGKEAGGDYSSSGGQDEETSDSSTGGGWDDSRLDLRNPPQRDIDLTSG